MIAEEVCACRGDSTMSRYKYKLQSTSYTYKYKYKLPVQATSPYSGSRESPHKGVAQILCYS